MKFGNICPPWYFLLGVAFVGNGDDSTRVPVLTAAAACAGNKQPRRGVFPSRYDATRCDRLDDGCETVSDSRNDGVSRALSSSFAFGDGVTRPPRTIRVRPSAARARNVLRASCHRLRRRCLLLLLLLLGTIIIVTIVGGAVATRHIDRTGRPISDDEHNVNALARGRRSRRK